MSADDVHLSIDELADFGADAMPPADAAAAQSHLRICADCRATSELLAGVPAILSSVADAPIPAEVTARVVAAIEREQIARGGAPYEVPANVPAGDTSSPGRQAVGLRRRFGARLGAGLLGAAAVFGGGYLVVSGALGGGAADSPSAAEAEQAPAVGGGATGTSEVPADAPLSYSAATLDDDVIRLLAMTPYSVDASRSVQGPDGEIGEPDDVATKARACVAATERRAGSTAAPLAVDLGTYDGRGAVVIVLPTANSGDGAAPVDVWVLGTGCLGADESDVDTVEADLVVLAHRSVQP